MKHSVLVCSIILALTGCSAKYQRVDLGYSLNIARLERNKGVFVSVPNDGYYGTTRYHGSGQMTAHAIKTAFSYYTSNIKVSSNCLERDQCLTKALKDKYSYLVFSEILHWEERATEWSGKPDRIEIKLTVIDVDTKNEIHSVILKGKSKWATFGGDHPQDLLPDPINNYVSTLF